MAAAEQTVVTGDIQWLQQSPLVEIDPEFRDLIPPLTSEELELLEKDLIEHGCLDSLKACRINGILKLLDGHNRLPFCEKHGIPYTIDIIDGISDRIDAKIWIINNQFARRNLSKFARSELALKLKPLIAEKAKKNQGTRTDIQPNSAESFKPIDTREELRKMADVSHDTISKTETILATGSDLLKEAARSGSISVNVAAEIAELPLKTQDRIVKSDKQGITKIAATIKAAKRDVRRQQRRETFNTAKQETDQIKPT